MLRSTVCAKMCFMKCLDYQMFVEEINLDKVMYLSELGDFNSAQAVVERKHVYSSRVPKCSSEVPVSILLRTSTQYNSCNDFSRYLDILYNSSLYYPESIHYS